MPKTVPEVCLYFINRFKHQRQSFALNFLETKTYFIY